MNKIIKQTMTTVWLSLFCFSASATIIFEDDFNRANSNNLGSDWSTIETDGDDVAIVNNTLRMRDDFLFRLIDAAATQHISTESFDDIYINFEWKALIASESSDTLFLSWYDGSNWTDIWQTGLGSDSDSFASVSVGAISGANDLSDFGFRFRIDVDEVFGNNEGVYLDNIVLRGTPIPEASSLVLLGLGLACVGFFRRQKKS